MGCGCGSDLARYMQFWLMWNRKCEAISSWRFRVEELSPGSETAAEFIQRSGLPKDTKWPLLRRNINSRAADPKYLRPQWGDLRSACYILAEQVQELADGYGYNV